MHALGAHHRGGPRQLVYEPAPPPPLGIGDVLAAVRAACFTPTELDWPSTWTDRLGRDRTPVIPAHEVSGAVAIDHLQAAAVPLAALTAFQALFDHGRLEAGQRVLIHGAAGGVGVFAVQLAHAAGTHVLATGRGPDHALLAGLGAPVSIDVAEQRFEDAAGRVDLVLDLVGGGLQAKQRGGLPGKVVLGV